MAIKHKRTSTASYSWQSSDLAEGQIGLNIADGTLHFKKTNNTIVTVGAGGSGTVTSVGGTGSVNGLTLTGTVTTSGNLTLGGTLDLSSPPAIGETTASTVRGTTVTATTQFSGPGTGLTGTASSLTAGVASAVTLTADNTTNATNYPLFANAATGDLSPRTDTGFTYNPSTGVLTATTFSGALTGTASNATNLYAQTYTANQSYYPFLSPGSGAIYYQGGTSTNLSFNPSTGVLTATSFSGALNGTVGATTPAAGTFTTLTVNAANDLRLADSDSSNYVGFKAPATVSTNKIWTLPSADGTSGQVLSTNGSGTLNWSTVGGITQGIFYSSVLNPNGSTSSYTSMGNWSQIVNNANITIASGNKGIVLPVGTWRFRLIFQQGVSSGSGTSYYELWNATDFSTIQQASASFASANAFQGLYSNSDFVVSSGTKTIEVRGYSPTNSQYMNGVFFEFWKIA